MVQPVTSHEYDEHTLAFVAVCTNLPPLELLAFHPSGQRLARIDDAWLVHIGPDTPDTYTEWVFPAVLRHAGGAALDWTATFETYGCLLVTHFTR